MSPIAHHPDVKRMLLTMRGVTDASRALCYALAHAIDRSRHGPEAEREAYAARAALLTPVAKAFSTDSAVTVASLGIQVHGGMGFIEETGAAQHLRDARILPIYEGTNGIQAIDLVTRKLPLEGGGVVAAYIAELRGLVAEALEQGETALAALAERAAAGLDDLAAATAVIEATQAEGRQTEVLAVATPYLRLFALAAGGAYHLKAALADRTAGTSGAAAERRFAVARFFLGDILPETAALARAVAAGGAGLSEVSPELLLSA